VTRFTVRSTAPTVVAYFRGRTKKVGPLFCPCLSYWPCDRRGKKADKVWRYHDADGRLLGLVARWDLLPDGTERKRKRILPFAWCRDALGREEWRSKHFPVPRPLYGLDRLATRKDAPVLISEGEKSADAAALIFPDYVCVTSPGGCEAGHKADWTPLAGRSATIWPDRKRPSGRKYAQTVAEILRGLRCDLALIDADAAASVAPDGTDRTPPDADQWDDAADALEEWPDREALRKVILQCAGPFSDVSDDEIDIEIEVEAEASAGKKSKWPPGFKRAAVMPVMSKHGAPQATASRRPRRRIMMLCSALMSLRKFPVRKRVRRPTCSPMEKASRDRRES
jgi:Domain of unknown function (DUF6371)